MIDLTETAIQQISTLCQEHNCYAISLNLKGGGCAGFEYEWGTMQEDEVEDNDHVVDCYPGKLVIGSYSQVYLIGSVIDYKKDLTGSMFDIRNPNAESSCGCGVSVNFNI